MSEPESKPLETGGMVYAPVGIGGWLILPIIHLVLNAAMILFEFGQGFMKGLAEEGVGKAHEVGAPELAGLTLAEKSSIAFVFFGFAIVIYALYCLLRFFQKRKSVPRLMIVFYFLLLTFTVINYLLIIGFPELQTSPQDSWDAAIAIFRVVVAVAIWIPYFFVSVRVKNTFVR